MTDPNTDRPWQPKVVKDILDLVKSGTKRIILNAPTGSGKTKIALELIRTVFRENGLDSYVAVRTMNEMIPYDETVAKFQMGLIYRYMIGKRRGCAYYTEGDDANTPLCDACLGREIVIEKYTDEWGKEKKKKVKQIVEENARRVIRPDEVFKDAPRGLSYLEEKYVGNKRAQICLYQSLKQIPSDFALMTYPYLLNKTIRNGTRLDFSKSLLVVDEAHNLEGAAGFSYIISTGGIEKAGKEFLSKCLPKIPGFDAQNLGVALSRFSRLISKFSMLPPSPGFEIPATLEEGERASEYQKARLQDKQDFLSRLENDLKGDYEVICDAYEKVESAKRELAKEKKYETLRNPFFFITSFVESLTENYDDYELFSEGRGNLSIRLLDPAPALQILKQPEILVMMSGTMPSRDYVEKVWGIDGCSEISVLRDYAQEYYSVFSKDSIDFQVIQDPQVTTSWGNRKSGGEDLWQRYAQIINRTFEESNLSVLVCCPSYSLAQRISNYIQVPKFVEDRLTPIQEVKKLILAGGRRVILAVAHGKLLEGVELVEDEKSLIDCVVIAGIPYPVPDDLYKLRFAKVTQRLGIEDGTLEIGQFEREYFRHQPALMTVKQAIGRAARYPEDRAKIILADSRFNGANWRRDLL
ncbi:MAG TPA: helicase C-terminal domain-containing protein [Nitrososphaerales archaeon]|nr:helicase C-terminal domain-containing protein [Nitrososphaerales archaeon]